MYHFKKRHPRSCKRLRLTQEIQRCFKHLTSILIVLNIVLITLFIIMNSAYSTNGYTLTKLQKQYFDLLTQQKQLDNQLAQARSMTTLQKQLAQDNMKPTHTETETTYLKPKSYHAEASMAK